MNRRSLLAIAILLGLAGCGEVRERQQETQALNVIEECRNNARTVDGYDALSHKTSMIDVRDITPSMLSDESIPSKKELETVKALEPILNNCHYNIINFTQNAGPAFVPALESEYTNFKEATGILERGKLPWGDYNKFLLDNYKLAMQAAQQAQLQAASIDAAQREAAAAENANLMQSLQALSSSLRANRPVVTNCSQMGTFTNCVTR